MSFLKKRQLNIISRKQFLRLFALVVIGCLFFNVFLKPQESKAAFNKQINYQGKLADSTGQAVADDDYNMRFKICSDDQCNTVLWTETRTTTNRVDITSGLFSIMLGEVASLDSVDFDQMLYLEVEIGGTADTPAWDGAMTPCRPFGAVPAAFVADTLDGYDSTDFVASTSQSMINTLDDGTTGQVAISNGTSGLKYDSNLFWDSSNSRLGVGTDSPGDIFTVETDNTEGIKVVKGSIPLISSYGSDLYIGAEGGTNIQIYDDLIPTSDSIRGLGSSSRYWEYTYTDALYTTGNIGIATTTPGGTYGEKLTVAGDTYIEGNATSTKLAVVGGNSDQWNTAFSWGDWNGNIDISTDTNLATSGTLLDLTGDTLSINEGTLTDTKFCTYEAGIGIVCNSDASAGGATQLSELSDVGVTTPTNRNVMVADGDSWESRTLTEADISDLHSAVTITGEDYLTLSGQQITAVAINPDNLASTDFGDFTCDGTTCTLDTTYATTADFDTFAELQALVADKTLVNEEDAVTWDSLNTFSGGLLATASSTFASTLKVIDDFNAGDGTLFVDASTGRVGIGTTTPSATFEIADSSNVSTLIIEAGSSQNGVNLIELKDSSSNFLSGFTADGGLLLNTASTTVLNIQDGSGNSQMVFNTTSGSLGIATTTPAEKLSVDGNFYLTGNVVAGTWQGTAIDPAYLDSSVILSTEIDTFAELQSIVADKTLVNEEDAVTWDSLNTFSAGLYSTASSTIAGNATTTGHFTANDTLFVKDGRVGVGTTNNLDEKFVVSGSGSDFKIDTDGSYPILRNTAGLYLGVASDIFVLNGKNIRTYGSGGTRYMFFEHDGTDGILGTHTTGGDIVFSPLSVEKVRITEAGNIGIATTTPGGTYGEKLTVAGAGYFTGNIYTDGTVDGRDLVTDGSKLDDIEAGADVTDATNVATAGAIMDGDFTSNGIMTRTGAGTYSIITDNSINWDTAYTHSQLTSGNPHGVTASDVGLGSVENTTLSTWTGSTNITTLGTIGTGTWQGTAIDPTYLDSSVILSTEIDTFAELQAIVADKTLVNEEDAVTWDSLNTFSGGLLATASSTFASTLKVIDDFNAGDGTLFVDASTGRVGIGTTNPGVELELSTTENTWQYISSDSNDGNKSSALTFKNDWDDDGSLESVASIGVKSDEAALRFMAANNVSPSAVNFDNYTRMIIDSDGSIGVGATDPDSRLEIKGAGNTSATTALSVKDSDDIEILKVRDDSRVKIGVSADTTPDKVLDVAGNLNFDAVAEVSDAELAGIVATEGTGGSLGAGEYYYNIAYLTGEGSTAGNISSSDQPHITVSSGATINLTNIPTSSDPRVTGRIIYRVENPGDPYWEAYPLATIYDNTTTSYTDDGSITPDTTESYIYRKPDSTAGGLFIDDYSFLSGSDTHLALGKFSTVRMDSLFVGPSAGRYLDETSIANIGLGPYAYNSVDVGSRNIGVGNNVLREAENIYDVVAIGNSTGRYMGGTGNILMGRDTGYLASYQSGLNYNIFIGRDIGRNALSGASYNTLIGYDIDLQDPDGSNQLSIGNLLFGTGIDGTGTTVSNGNIGIATTTPEARLTVTGAGNSTATKAFKVENSDGDQLMMIDDSGAVRIGKGGSLGDGFLYAYPAGNQFAIRSSSMDKGFTFYTSGTEQKMSTNNDVYLNINGGQYTKFSVTNSEKMRLTSDGSLGIATTTPGGTYGEKLTVAGDGYFTGDIYGGGNINFASGGYFEMENSTQDPFRIYESSGDWYINGENDDNDDTSLILSTGAEDHIIMGPASIGGQYNDIDIGAYDDSEVVLNGQVGINTDSSTDLIKGLTLERDIQSGDYTIFKISNDATAEVNHAMRQDFTFKDSGGTETVFGRLAVNNKVVTDTSESGEMIFSTIYGGTLTENMRVSNGSLGIATTTPGGTYGEKLTVAGDGYFTGGLYLGGSLNQSGGAVSLATTTVSGDFTVQDSDGTSHLYVDNENGRVGVGTDSPTEKLEVAGNIKNAGTTASSQFIAGFGGTAQIITQDTNEDLTIDPNGSGDIIMQGNVGIGETNPANSLHIKDTTNNDGLLIEDTWYNYYIGTNNTETGNYFSLLRNSSNTEFQQSAGEWRFVTNGSRMMTIDTSGGVHLEGALTNDSGNIDIQATSGITELNTASTQNYLRVYDSATTDYIQITHDGSNALITTNVGNVEIGTAGNDVYLGAVGSASNLVFEESASILGQGGNAISLGQSDDIFNLNVSGVTYNFSTLTGGSTLALNASSTASTTVQVINNNNDHVANLAVEGSITTGSTSFSNYNNFGGGTAGQSAITNDDDVYITDDLEVDGTAYLSGGTSWTQGDFAENIVVRMLLKNEVTDYKEGPSSTNNGLVDDFFSLPEAGDVLVMDPENEWSAVKSFEYGSNQILGVVSTDPAGVLRGDLARTGEDVRPLALSGTVPVKVSLENGPITKGDLLTTSKYPGYATRLTNSNQGVIGIALENYNEEKDNDSGAADLIEETLEDIEEYKQGQMKDDPMSAEVEVGSQEDLVKDEQSAEIESLRSGKQILVLLTLDNKPQTKEQVAQTNETFRVVENNDYNFDVQVEEYEFKGNVAVHDLVVTGKVTVVGRSEFLAEVDMRDNLNIEGAIVRTYEKEESVNIETGDAVYLTSNGKVARAYADVTDDNDFFRPAIGLVVDIIENEAGDDETGDIVKVAIAGTVGGFRDLEPGTVYYLADAEYQIENDNMGQVLGDKTGPTSTDDIVEEEVTEDGLITLSALTNSPQQRIGNYFQTVAIAENENALLIMPSLTYQEYQEDVELPVIQLEQIYVENLNIDNESEEDQSESETENQTSEDSSNNSNENNNISEDDTLSENDSDIVEDISVDDNSSDQTNDQENSESGSNEGSEQSDEENFDSIANEEDGEQADEENTNSSESSVGEQNESEEGDSEDQNENTSSEEEESQPESQPESNPEPEPAPQPEVDSVSVPQPESTPSPETASNEE